VDIHDLVSFQATTLDELDAAFRDSVDDYLAFAQIGAKNQISRRC
jgi:hypothetical protein